MVIFAKKFAYVKKKVYFCGRKQENKHINV